MTSADWKAAILDHCTDAQREAIQHVSGPLLVLAGPGSGKTRVITRRVAYLVRTGCRPDEILAITFTNKAAGEMRGRVEALGVARGVWMFTFHAFCARILRIHAPQLDLKRSFTIYDTADSVAAVKRAMEQLEIDRSLFKPSYVVKAISSAKGKLWGPDDLADSHIRDAETMARIFEAYDRQLRASNAVDFDDLLLLVVKLLRDVPAVRDQLANRFRHVLIDEYQDTNHAQYVIAKHLAAGHHNICAAGDPDQSIYGWRGADLNNILDFEKDYADAKVVRLEQNYRSTRKILRVADKLIANNLLRKPKGLWTENPEGENLVLFQCEDETEEADAIAQDISGLVASGSARPRDIAIFYRINAQSRVLESALRAEATPYSIVAGTEFFQRREIKDLLAYLRLVLNPADDVSVERVANVPPRKIGGVSVKRLKAWAAARGVGLLDALARGGEAGLKGGALDGARGFIRILDRLRAMPPRPVKPIVARLIEISEYERYLSGGENAQERIENARELVNAAAEYDRAEPEGDLSGFLEQAALISDVDRWDEASGGVTLMTLHAAKGLEFPIVYIVGLEESLLPLSRNETAHDVEEERRLFFVGLTRAKRKVSLSMAVSRARYGSRGFTTRSRFLDELPEDAVETRAASGTPCALSRNRLRRKHIRRVRRSEAEEIVYDGDLPEEFCPFEPGETVAHPTYGRGEVLDVGGFGENLRVTVRFRTVGIKRLILRYAKLRKV